jgi:uncharacterized membrane protein YidH (DUF202 family)
MKITDRQIGVFALIISIGALVYGYVASNQNKEILAHTKDIKNNLT